MTEHLTETTTACPTCGGEGRVEEYRRARDPGGSWDTPYHDVECGECDGVGLRLVERCGRCGLVDEHHRERANGLWEVCRCGEDTLDAWALSGAGPEVSEAAAFVQAACFPSPGADADRRWARQIRQCAGNLREHAPQHPAAVKLAGVLDAIAEGIHSERKAA